MEQHAVSTVEIESLLIYKHDLKHHQTFKQVQENPIKQNIIFGHLFVAENDPIVRISECQNYVNL